MGCDKICAERLKASGGSAAPPCAARRLKNLCLVERVLAEHGPARIKVHRQLVRADAENVRPGALHLDVISRCTLDAREVDRHIVVERVGRGGGGDLIAVAVVHRRLAREQAQARPVQLDVHAARENGCAGLEAVEIDVIVRGDVG
jgi:hypothetical protein